MDHISCRCWVTPLLEEAPSTECSCEKCVGACEYVPGWFAPGEAEKAAEYLQMSFEIFQAFLIKDHCSNQEVDDAPFVWSPRKIGVDKPEDSIRTEVGQRLTGRCVFLKEGRCIIHPVKPYECRKVFACNFKSGTRDEIEQLYIKAGAPLGMRPHES